MIKIEVDPSSDEVCISEPHPATTLQINVNTRTGTTEVTLPREVVEQLVDKWLGQNKDRNSGALKAFGITFNQ